MKKVATILFDTIKKTLSLRSVRYGGNTLAVSLILLVILGLINFVVTRHSYRVDLTAGKQFSLAPQTQKVLKNLKKDVKVTAFFKSGDKREMEDLLKAYRFYSKKFSYEFIDPDRKPAIAKRYGIRSYRTSVVECSDKEEKITSTQEQDLTNALIKVTREGQKVIYFLEGHGENNIDDTGRTGYSSAKKAIEAENYKVKKLILAEKKSIPKDCSILIISGAKKKLFPAELDTIQTYLERGGKALFLLDPEPSFGFTDFLDKWGLKIENDVVLDVSGVGRLFGMGPAVPLVSSYEPHEITRKFRMMTFYPYARSVTPEKNPGNGLTVKALFKTNSGSWGETNLKNGKARFDKGVDLPGPVTLGVVITKKVSNDASGKKKTRLVVIGDSDFANNSYFGVQGNGDLFMNIVSWLAEEEDLISVRAKRPEDRRVFMTARQAKWVMYLTVILMPLAAVGVGVGVYMRRKRR